MSEYTTIQLEKSIVDDLKSIKQYPRQTYGELIVNIIKYMKSTKETNQYDEFLHKIQQMKMKELWDNKEDEAWENA